MTETIDEIESLAKQLWCKGIRWRTYVNKMRNDGLFVAEDKPIDPYEAYVRGWISSPKYPATPNTEHALSHQLPHEDAERLVEILNRDTAPE